VIAWQAVHDLGLDGFASSDISRAIEQLRKIGYQKLVVSQEIPESLGDDEFLLRPQAEDFHHLLAYADLCLSESITVAGEAGVLGVPALLVNPLRAGHTLELERYGLVKRFETLGDALHQAQVISESDDAAVAWRDARARLLSDKSDMTQDFVAILAHELGMEKGIDCAGQQ
jgi:predicted glycosyltransferase